MRIKRTGVQTSKKVAMDKDKKSEASISRQAPGMCFAFHPTVCLINYEPLILKLTF